MYSSRRDLNYRNLSKVNLGETNMHRTLALLFAAVALAVAAGKTYTFTLYDPAMAGATELKPGEHSLQIVDGNAFIVDGKPATRTPVKVETANEKFSRTSILVNTGGGKRRIEEISLGGSNTKLVVAMPAADAGAGSSSAAGASN
jgi:hypothetical protein